MKRMASQVLFAKLYLVLFISSSWNVGLANDKASKIDAYLTQSNDIGQFSGTALVAQNGKVIYKKAFGYANLEWQVPNEIDSKFRISSMSKQFTAMLIMQLVEEEKINVEGKITDYLPKYRKDTGDRITIHQLLTHTSGIEGMPGWSDLTRKNFNVAYIVENLCIGDLAFEPGSLHRYSNTGYYLLGAIIEAVTDKPFAEVLREKILNPLDMSNTGIDDESKILRKRASGYNKPLAEYVNDRYFVMEMNLSNGAMYSTVDDLHKWDQALYTEKLVSQKSKKSIFTPYLSNYGYGWRINKRPLANSSDSVRVVWHLGTDDGFTTRIDRLVDDQNLVVLLSNTAGTGLSSMTRDIISILYDRPYSLPKPSIAEITLNTLVETDVTAAVNRYHYLKKNHEGKYDFSQDELNNLGYQLLYIDRVTDAIEIFKLNVEAYPDASNPYDSLGEAYMINGAYELATKNYEKAIELNPDNGNAIRMVKKIQEKMKSVAK